MAAEAFCRPSLLMQACRVRMLFQPAMSEGTAGFFYFKPLPKPRSYTQKYESSLTGKNVFNIPLHLT